MLSVLCKLKLQRIIARIADVAVQCYSRFKKHIQIYNQETHDETFNIVYSGSGCLYCVR